MMRCACLLCGLGFLAVAGCQSPYGSYPGYSYPQPTMPSGGYLPAQGPTMVPSGAPVMTPSTGQGVSPGLGTASGPTSAPPFKPSRTPAGPADKTVPNYPDQATPATKSKQDFDVFDNENENFKAPIEHKKLKQLEEDDRNNSWNEPKDSDDGFETPAKFQPVSYRLGEDDPTDEEHSGETRLNPYAYDAKEYSWLRGVVEYDEDTEGWYIVYDDEPDKDDRYGGKISLADHPKLSVLKRSEVILVQGKIDDEQVDHLGKPKYLIEQMGRCVPEKKAT